MTRGQIISCLKDCNIVDKGFIYNVIRFKYVERKTTSIKSLHVVKEFPTFFPNGRPRVPPKWEINIFVDLFADTNHISIAPFRMAPAELKELKLQHKDLSYKGFIQPSISPWGVHVLFVKKKDGFLRMLN